MPRQSLDARFAGASVMILLMAGSLGQASRAVVSSPQPVAAIPPNAEPISPKVIGRGSIDVRDLLAHPTTPRFSPTVASAALSRLDESNQIAGPLTRLAPAGVTPPLPDLATDSGQPPADIPINASGDTQAGSGGFQPADPGMAMGPDVLIEADNLSVRLADRYAATMSSLPLATFFELPEDLGFTTYDAHPRVHFDSLRHRWVATELSWDCTPRGPGDPAVFGHGNLDFAISDTADPLGHWTVALFQYADAVPDLPNFGTSTDKLGLTATLFNMGPGGGVNNPGCIGGGVFQGSDVIVMDWAQLGSGFDPAKVTAVGDSFDVGQMQFAVQEPVTAPELRLVERFNGTTPADVVTLSFTGSAAKHTVAFDGFDLTDDGLVSQFMDAAAPHQPGGTLTGAISGLPDSAIYSNGVLAFTSTYPCTPSTDTSVRNCIRVTTLGVAGANVEPTRLGDTLLASKGFDNSFGGIAFAGNGALEAVYTRSSSSSFASSFAQYNLPGEASSQWSPPQLLTAGVAQYGPGPWGTHLTVSADPQDPTGVWVADPWANSSGGWSTSIHELVVGGTGAGYFPLTPVRVLDSRSPVSAPVGFSGALVANTPEKFAVGGTHGIPTDAVAITGNLTVTGQTAAGYLSLTPTPTATPPSSTLNFPIGDTRANNLTVALARDGSLAVVYKATGGRHTHVVLDVTGYFQVGVGQTYFPLAPDRVLDSRSDPVTHAFVANVSKAFPVAGTLINGVTIPSSATAVTANLTVTGQSKAGYVSLTPTDNDNPQTSNLNFPVGDTRANGLTIPLDPLTGDVSAVYKAQGGTVNLVLDVTGYYSTVGGGLLFHPLNPGRWVDTRLPLGGQGFTNGLSGPQGSTPRQIPIAAHDGVGGVAAAFTGNLTITGQTAAGFVSITQDLETHPSTSTINFPLGDTRANGITASLYGGDIYFVYQGGGGKSVQLILDITGYFQ
jgi:hypothetical protein